MSALKTNERDSRGSVLSDAPRHLHTLREDGTIRPILERLNQGENDLPRLGYSLPPLGPIGARQRGARTFPYWLVATAAAVAGVSVGLVVLEPAWLGFGGADQVRAENGSISPKSVRTVSFKQEAPQDAGPAPTQTSDAGPVQDQFAKAEPTPSAEDATDKKQTQPEDGRQQLLTLWTAVPTDLRAQTAVAAPKETTAESAPEAEPPTSATEAKDTRAAKPHHRRRYGHSRRRHHAVRTAAPQRSARNPAAPVQQESASAADPAVQPSDPNPLQSAFQNFFNQGSAGQSTPAPNSAFRNSNE